MWFNFLSCVVLKVGRSVFEGEKLMLIVVLDCNFFV